MSTDFITLCIPSQSINGGRPPPHFVYDPSTFAFRSLSTLKPLSPIAPVEEPSKPLTVDYIAECAKQLSKQLGRGVKITNGKRKGHLDIEFYGPDDLQQLLDALEQLQRKEATT